MFALQETIRPSADLRNHYNEKRQGYRILIVEKNLVFYKVDERKKEVIVYAVVDQRRDCLKIIRVLYIQEVLV